ncbi:MAG: ATPase [Rhodospirillales bacterium CG15_BIG_FIL_POST_REV_8_21_14_020_66_15]|nr:MAG: ATPase [Rhodospirillales bacterium CG15_BIG_FIL_POST_REV_8_21_14_020_66_15]
MNAEDYLNDFEAFRQLPHAITLLGMSGVGKTMLSTSLRRKADWFHYSADYRIGTRYLSEHILDNIKYKIMHMQDPFVANLLRSDSIYINHNISVDNLDPVSTFLGMYGDPAQGGLDKATFLERQNLYKWGEQESMKDTGHFVAKAWEIYRCKDFVNDASGSLCEVVDLDDPNDPVIAALRAETLILYIRAGQADEEALMERAETDPKPLFYHPAFIEKHLAGQPDDGRGVGPKDFARKLFPDLVQDRKPRYQAMADRYGFTIDVAGLFADPPAGQLVPGADKILRRVLETIRARSMDNEVAAANARYYVNACRARAQRRARDI